MQQASDFFTQVGHNTRYIIHPEEILADNFALLVLAERNPPSPEIIERLQGILKESRHAEPGHSHDTTWEFNDLKEWQDDSQGSSPKSYAIANGVLRISTRAQTRDRVKVRTIDRFGVGTYRWRVYVPKMGEGDQASIGVFLYKDDQHELDFEIGYGKASLRKTLKASPTELVCYCTSQGFPSSSSQIVLEREAWHSLSIEIDYGRDGHYVITWSVDEKQVKQLQTAFGDETTFTVHCSVENLFFMGDHIPTQKNHALFDRVEFVACKRVAN